jgi:hypothetical protein
MAALQKALGWFYDVTYQRFTAVLLIYENLFLTGIYYSLRTLIGASHYGNTLFRVYTGIVK